MKGKVFFSGDRYLAGVLPAGCWVVTRPWGRRRTDQFKNLWLRHRRGVDLLLSVAIIGGMFLLGIWGVLVQLAEY